MPAALLRVGEIGGGVTTCVAPMFSMLNWLKQIRDRNTLRSTSEELDAFLAELRSATDSEIAMIVAMATHHRNTMADMGINMLSLAEVQDQDPTTSDKLVVLIDKAHDREEHWFAAGLAVWYHSIRAANSTTLRVQGQALWHELRRGYGGAEAAAAAFEVVSGQALRLRDIDLVPLEFSAASTEQPTACDSK